MILIIAFQILVIARLFVMFFAMKLLMPNLSNKREFSINIFKVQACFRMSLLEGCFNLISFGKLLSELNQNKYLGFLNSAYDNS